MSEFEPNLKFTISEEINSLLDNKNMIYKTNLIEAFNLDYFNLLYYIQYFFLKKINIMEFFFILWFQIKTNHNTTELKGKKR